MKYGGPTEPTLSDASTPRMAEMIPLTVKTVMMGRHMGMPEAMASLRPPPMARISAPQRVRCNPNPARANRPMAMKLPGEKMNRRCWIWLARSRLRSTRVVGENNSAMPSRAVEVPRVMTTECRPIRHTSNPCTRPMMRPQRIPISSPVMIVSVYSSATTPATAAVDGTARSSSPAIMVRPKARAPRPRKTRPSTIV